MSLATAPAYRRPRGTEAVPVRLPSRVQLVASRLQTRPKVGYAVIVVGVIFGIFLAQLLLSIALSGGAYKIAQLQGDQRTLTRTASSLDERLLTVASTQNLAANARALGMVSDSSPAFLRLSDGKVVGAGAVAASGQPGSSKVANGAGGSVPNSLLTDIPVVQTSSSGHGDANTADTSTDTADSNSPPSTAGSQAPIAADSGDLPSPNTH